MQEDIDMAFEIAEDSMKSALDRLKSELTKIRTGKASPNLVSGIYLDYYGSQTPINQVANVGLADSRTIVIQPWEKPMLGAIEQAIFQANLGITPQNDGEIIRLIIQPLTEERRREMVRKAKDLGEDGKVSVRNARRDLMDEIKKAVKGGYPEDNGKDCEKSAQEMTNDFGKEIDNILEKKETDIMTV